MAARYVLPHLNLRAIPLVFLYTTLFDDDMSSSCCLQVEFPGAAASVPLPTQPSEQGAAKEVHAALQALLRPRRGLSGALSRPPGTLFFISCHQDSSIFQQFSSFSVAFRKILKLARSGKSSRAVRTSC